MALATLLITVAWQGSGAAAGRSATPPRVNGPEADYPMVLGVPYTVGTTVFTPVDTLNYDAVGYATLDDDGGSAITGAHHSLPLPSYVEVTSLDSGKTILVRLERRGPMDGANLVGLSPGAAAQLGLDPGHKSAVRVRRVNPPESERAMLRAGGPAPERMATPKPLLAVLLRKLAPDASVQLARESGEGAAPPSPPPQPPQPAKPERPRVKPATVAARPVPQPAPPEPAKPAAPVNLLAQNALPLTAAGAPKPHVEPSAAAAPKAETPALAAPSAAHAASGSVAVQVGAYAVKAHADAVAQKIGADVRQGGKLWRVRMGPFTNHLQADAALAKARAAGYSEARIQRAD